MSTVMWAAEIGSAHKGDMGLGYEMVRQFSKAGASVIKIQLGWTRATQERYGLEYKPAREVSLDFARKLHHACKDFGVELISSIWSHEGLNQAKELELPIYKIAAKVSKDLRLSKEIYAEGKPVFVSLERHDINARFHISNSGTLIWCRSIYPCYPDDLAESNSLPGMPNFANGEWYGYSDHMHGTGACLLAVSRGALYIEKHVALDKTDLVTRDTVFSASPEEFAEMVSMGNELRRLLNSGV